MKDVLNRVLGMSDNRGHLDLWRFFFYQTIANYTVQMKMLLTESVLRAHVKLKSITENKKFKKVAINNSHVKTKKESLGTCNLYCKNCLKYKILKSFNQ